MTRPGGRPTSRFEISAGVSPAATPARTIFASRASNAHHLISGSSVSRQRFCTAARVLEYLRPNSVHFLAPFSSTCVLSAASSAGFQDWIFASPRLFLSVPMETASVPMETASVPSVFLSVPMETLSVPVETLSVPSSRIVLNVPSRVASLARLRLPRGPAIIVAAIA